MIKVPMLRTVPQTVEIFRAEDPNTKINAYMLRQLIKQKKIPVVFAGRKQLLNINVLMDFLNFNMENMNEMDDMEANEGGYGTIRKVNE